MEAPLSPRLSAKEKGLNHAMRCKLWQLIWWISEAGKDQGLVGAGEGPEEEGSQQSFEGAGSV